MALYCRVLQVSDLEEILAFEAEKLAEQIPDESERMFASWNSKARKEALEHHAALGWSFLVRDQDKKSSWSEEGLLAGYFIAQPFLFVDGQTQSLWVEHMRCEEGQPQAELIDLAYRLSREKHFQRIYLPHAIVSEALIGQLKGTAWQPEVITIKTTKAL